MQQILAAAYVLLALTFPAEALIGQPGTLAMPGTSPSATPISTQPAPEAPAPRS